MKTLLLLSAGIVISFVGIHYSFPPLDFVVSVVGGGLIGVSVARAVCGVW